MRLTAGFFLSCFSAFAQQPAFEVASVKPVAPFAREPIDIRILPNGVKITNLTLQNVVLQAFGVKRYQLSGGPEWMDSDRFDITAKVSREVPSSEILAMLRALLADRFELKTHRESREGNVFMLVVARGGPKLKESTATESRVSLFRNTPVDQPGVSYTIAGQKASMEIFASRLAEMEIGRPVLDRTGLRSEYDFKLTYATNDDPDVSAPVYTAIQEQLGLKLEAGKGPIDMLFIDHAVKPSAN